MDVNMHTCKSVREFDARVHAHTTTPNRVDVAADGATLSSTEFRKVITLVFQDLTPIDLLLSSTTTTSRPEQPIGGEGGRRGGAGGANVFS